MDLIKKVLFFLLLLFFFSSFTKNFLDYKKNVGFYESYKQEYEDEKKRNIALKTEILKAQDPHEVEKTIRNKLNLLKTNEIAIIIPNPTPTPVITTPTPAPVYMQWWNTFFPN